MSKAVDILSEVLAGLKNKLTVKEGDIASLTADLKRAQEAASGMKIGIAGLERDINLLKVQEHNRLNAEVRYV